MVWKSTGSTLYQAVERHNSGESRTPEPQHSEHSPSQGMPRCTEQHRSQPQSMLSGLLQDKDFLLLAAVMLILMHEKADNKLIMALAFVLFA